MISMVKFYFSPENYETYILVTISVFELVFGFIDDSLREFVKCSCTIYLVHLFSSELLCLVLILLS